MTLGQEIRRLREERGWSQAKLGVLSGTGPSGISQIETGRRNPSAATLQRIAEALGVGIADLFPKGQAPLPDFDGERREAAYDLALDAARRQARQDAQAAARLEESGRGQTWFMRHDNEAMQRLLGYSTDELSDAVLEMAHRVVQEEQRPSPLAASLFAVITHWLEIISNTPAESTAGAVEMALELEGQLSVLMGDERQWSRVTPLQRSEIFQLMKMIEDLAERYMARMEAEADHAEVINLEDLRQRLEQSRESRRRAEAHSA